MMEPRTSWPENFLVLWIEKWLYQFRRIWNSPLKFRDWDRTSVSKTFLYRVFYFRISTYWAIEHFGNTQQQLSTRERLWTKIGSCWGAKRTTEEDLEAGRVYIEEERGWTDIKAVPGEVGPAAWTPSFNLSVNKSVEVLNRTPALFETMISR